MYNQLQIAIILANCDNDVEVIKACIAFKCLIDAGCQEHEDLIRTISVRRLEYLSTL
jgi:hypothetical protein